MPEPLIKTEKYNDGSYNITLTSECGKMLKNITTSLNQKNEAETLLFLLENASQNK